MSERTAAILAVHLYGQLCDMDGVRAARATATACSCSRTPPRRTARRGGRQARRLARDAAGFSFYPSKNLGALGDGGAITTDDAEIAARRGSLRNLGQRAKGEHVDRRLQRAARRAAGGHAAVKLARLDEWNEQRRLRAASYVDALDDRDACPRRQESRTPASTTCSRCGCSDRDGLQAPPGGRRCRNRRPLSAALHQQPALRGVCVAELRRPDGRMRGRPRSFRSRCYPGLAQARHRAGRRGSAASIRVTR